MGLARASYRNSEAIAGEQWGWITSDAVELIHYMNGAGLIDWEIVEVEDRNSNHGNGFTIVCRKRANRNPVRRR